MSAASGGAWSIRQVAEASGVDKSSVDRLIRAGVLATPLSARSVVLARAAAELRTNALTRGLSAAEQVAWVTARRERLAGQLAGLRELDAALRDGSVTAESVLLAVDDSPPRLVASPLDAGPEALRPGRVVLLLPVGSWWAAAKRARPAETGEVPAMSG